MKILEILKYKTVVTLLVITGSSYAAPSDFTFRETKNFSRSYAVTDGVSVDVRNKYGQVIFSNWDKDSVKFEIEVISEGDKLSKVLENINGISVSFTGNKVYVEARTNWKNDDGFIRKSVNDIRRSLSGSLRVEINYHVYIPRGADINVENRFGDVFMTDIEGTLNAEISHGNLRASSLNKIRRLKIRYGDVRFHSCKYATIDAGYGNVEIEECKELNLTGTSTEIVLGKIEDLNLISKNDHIDIEEVDKLSGTLTITDLRINKLVNKADINSKLGSVRLKNINPSFTRIHLSGSYTSYTIITDSGMNSGFKVTMENGKEFIYPKTVSITSTDTIDKTEIYKGHIGTGGENKIIIQSKNGKVRFEM